MKIVSKNFVSSLGILSLMSSILIGGCAANIAHSPAKPPVETPAAAPSIMSQPASKTVNAGQAAIFTVSASGGAALTYQWAKNGAPISGATSASYTTAPTTASDKPAQFVVVVSNTSASVTSDAASLTVAAAGTVLLDAAASTLSFGNIGVGSSGTHSLVLTNAGTSDVTISQVLIAGAGFNVTGANGIILTPGQSTTLTSTFAPSASGAATGKLTISSNATNSPATVALSGTGVATATHSVSLSWTDTSSGVTGFNTYSSTVAGGPFAKISATPSSSPSFTDDTVQAGRTYYYVVTALNNANQESAYSAEVTAIVP